MKTVIITILLILLSAPAIAKNVEPTSADVKRELNELLSKMNDSYEKSCPALSSGNSKKEIENRPNLEFLEIDLPEWVKYFFLGVLIFAVMLLLYLIFRNPVISDKDKVSVGSSGKKSIKSEEIQKRFEHFYDQAKKTYKNGDYAQAVLNLHKATVEYIHLKKIRHRRFSYTNSELRIFISDNLKLSNSFIQIARESESIMFGNVPASESRCNTLVRSFEENFIHS